MYLSVITFNVNGLSAPTKRHRVAEWMRKQDLHICCLQETHIRSKNTHRLKVKEWKKTFHTKGIGKKAEVAALISNKIDFKTKAVVRDKKRTLHNDKGNNPTRGYNHSKHLYTQHWSN